jgi:hypothetical protein
MEVGQVVRIVNDPKSGFYHRIGTIEGRYQPAVNSRLFYRVRVHEPVADRIPEGFKPINAAGAGYFEPHELEAVESESVP